MQARPKLRTVEKYNPPYPLGKFPVGFAQALGREAAYIMATRPSCSFEGSDWEDVFARCIGAEWTPSNVGLDDVRLSQTAWGAKTVKATNPHSVERVRLISGRNSIEYSFGVTDKTKSPPNEVGSLVLDIWNERVDGIRQNFHGLRTVVLIKSNKDLSKMAVFETETHRYPTDRVEWLWNKNKNLEGRVDGVHRFTWQPHGAQFTIIEDVPPERLLITVKKPILVPPDVVLKSVGFDASWINTIDPSLVPQKTTAAQHVVVV